MQKVTQTELAAYGAKVLRQQLALGAFPNCVEALTALCDYTEKTIEARASGGRRTKPETARLNGAKGGRPKGKKGKTAKAAKAT